MSESPIPPPILLYIPFSNTHWFPADDDNLIILDPIPGEEDCQSDYINACYVDVSVCDLFMITNVSYVCLLFYLQMLLPSRLQGFVKQNKFIASQGISFIFQSITNNITVHTRQ